MSYRTPVYHLLYLSLCTRYFYKPLYVHVQMFTICCPPPPHTPTRPFPFTPPSAAVTTYVALDSLLSSVSPTHCKALHTPIPTVAPPTSPTHTHTHPTTCTARSHSLSLPSTPPPSPIRWGRSTPMCCFFLLAPAVPTSTSPPHPLTPPTEYERPPPPPPSPVAPRDDRRCSIKMTHFPLLCGFEMGFEKKGGKGKGKRERERERSRAEGR